MWKVETIGPAQDKGIAIQVFNDPRKNNKINSAIWKDCPICSSTVRKNNKFCLNCGFKLLN
jgi:hypothetical protein